MQIMEARPPYVIFETRSEEDRQASIEQGHYVGKDVDYALITPAGSKDRIDRLVSDWLPQTKLEAEAGRMPAAWSEHFHKSYQAWKAGQELAVDGTPIADWPGLSPTQYKTLTSLGIRAVEDLAQANEETINRLGMGGRMLKQRAVDYLAASKNVGSVAEKASMLQAKLEASESREKLLQERLERLEAMAQSQQSGQAPRPDSMTAAINADDILDDTPPPAARRL